MKIVRAVVVFGIAIGASGIPTGCSGGVVGGNCRRDLCSSGSPGGTAGERADGAAGALDASPGGVGGASGDTGFGGAGGAGGRIGGGGFAGASGASGASGAGATDASGSGGGGGDGGVICIPPFTTPAHCGDCSTQCSGATPVCGLGTDGYACVPLCTAPLVDCGGLCVNTDNDEKNCGGCGRVCPSGICQSGTCVGANAGHEILFCMDYEQVPTPGTPPDTLLENAIFLHAGDPVRVYGAIEFTPPAIVTTVKRALDQIAMERKRGYTLTTTAKSLDVTLDLSVVKYDVLLVYDQPNAPAGTLSKIGAAWSDSIDAFVRAGGSVVVLAGDAGRGEMGDLITNAGLLDVTGQTSITGKPAYNRAFGDAIGINVLTTFLTRPETCTFQTTSAVDSSLVFVVTDAPTSADTLGAPVVVHRVIPPS